MMIQIRNMESSRCISLVMKQLQLLEISYKTVELGKVELHNNISREKLKQFDFAIRSAGLEIIRDKNDCLIESIKIAINDLIYNPDDLPKQVYSEFISRRVNYDYTYLSNLFSNDQGITIEKYIISQKIERVKVLLAYDEISLNDIAFKLQYSSVAHLSNQFKKVTGLTPSLYRNISATKHCNTLNM